MSHMLTEQKTLMSSLMEMSLVSDKGTCMSLLVVNEPRHEIIWFLHIPKAEAQIS